MHHIEEFASLLGHVRSWNLKESIPSTLLDHHNPYYIVNPIPMLTDEYSTQPSSDLAFQKMENISENHKWKKMQ